MIIFEEITWLWNDFFEQELIKLVNIRQILLQIPFLICLGERHRHFIVHQNSELSLG